jgi:hypothetical protein
VSPIQGGRGGTFRRLNDRPIAIPDRLFFDNAPANQAPLAF